jgi:cytochrome c oxidase subunit 2
MDACPGRLNELAISIKREGVFFGQCSELCGINHAFMPIVLESLNYKNFMFWYDFKLQTLLSNKIILLD